VAAATGPEGYLMGVVRPCLVSRRAAVTWPRTCTQTRAQQGTCHLNEGAVTVGGNKCSSSTGNSRQQREL
jgi:hypothetical protein